MSAALILAAGFSRRFGGDKRQHLLADGQPMLLATVHAYRRVFDTLSVVIRPEDAALRQLLGGTQDIKVIESANAHLGMGHSLAAGVRAMPDSPELFIALGDMPYVQQQTLVLLCGELENADRDAIVVPVHQHQPGHPIGFSHCYFDALSNLTGDTGARDVVAAAGAAVCRIEVDDPGVIRDVDVPGD